MTDTNVASSGDAPAIESSAVELTVPGTGELSIREAARAVSAARQKKSEAPVDAPVKAAPEAAPKLAEEANAAPEEVRSETTEADPAELPPIEPPRSWTKEDKELFNTLPRETQERVADRERSRESDFLRRQNEAATKLQGLTAKEQQAEQAKQQYESALPLLQQQLQALHAGEFSDIKTMEDVQRMAAEDWPRYAKWDAQQKQIAAVNQEVTTAQARQQQEMAKKWSEFATEQDRLLNEKVPDLADPAKAERLRSSALNVLKDIGFEDQELASAWNGQSGLSLRDHRLQMLILDGVRYREGQQKVREVKAQSVPPVQRPGVAPARGADNDAKVQALNERLNKSGSVNDAIALMRAKRAAG